VPRLYPEPLESPLASFRDQLAYVDPSRTGIQFWDAIRIRIKLLVGPDFRSDRSERKVVEAVLDTGALLTLFPFHAWTTIPRSLIEYVEFPPGVQSRSLSVGGTRCPFRLGWIWLGVRDDERPVGRLPTQRVLAQFAQDGGQIKSNALVGLSHSVLTGRRLVRETTLEPDEPDPADSTRRRRTFGQVWRLTSI